MADGRWQNGREEKKITFLSVPSLIMYKLSLLVKQVSLVYTKIHTPNTQQTNQQNTQTQQHSTPARALATGSGLRMLKPHQTQKQTCVNQDHLLANNQNTKNTNNKRQRTL